MQCPAKFSAQWTLFICLQQIVGPSFSHVAGRSARVLTAGCFSQIARAGVCCFTRVVQCLYSVHASLIAIHGLNRRLTKLVC